jgi:hypothetical protein
MNIRYEVEVGFPPYSVRQDFRDPKELVFHGKRLEQIKHIFPVKFGGRAYSIFLDYSHPYTEYSRRWRKNFHLEAAADDFAKAVARQYPQLRARVIVTKHSRKVLSTYPPE